MTKNILPIVAILTLAMTGPAFAVQSGSAQQVRIKYSKAELNTESARRQLEKRISMAVRNVCGEPVTGAKEEADLIRDCRSAAREMAVAQVPVRFAARD